MKTTRHFLTPLRSWRDTHASVNVLTIPRVLAQEGDLVILPRKEYEALVRIRPREFFPTASQRAALKRAERNFLSGKTLSFNDLAGRLGFTG